jgi:hypothetical protein
LLSFSRAQQKGRLGNQIVLNSTAGLNRANTEIF